MQGRRNVAATITNGTASAAGGRRTAARTKSNTGRGGGVSPGPDFNPKLITAQIVALQCFHYFLLALLFQGNHVLYGTSITLDRIFTDRHVMLWNRTGFADALAFLIASLMGSVFLAIIVEKSKKCLDFSATLFLVHLVITTFYGGFPHRLDWWIVHIAGTIAMVVFGEYLCSRRELEEIPLLQI